MPFQNVSLEFSLLVGQHMRIAISAVIHRNPNRAEHSERLMCVFLCVCVRVREEEMKGL